MKIMLLAFLLAAINLTAQDYASYVNPMIGTGGHGHTFPGATTPFGFVQLSPDTRPDGYNDWDGCSGYHYSDSMIYGFSHTHLSGTGVPDYCDVLLSPYVGQPGDNFNSAIPPYASTFSHANEHASPGYYSVLLNDDSIFVELTATARVGMHRYQFPKNGKSRVQLNLMHRDQLLEGSFIEIVSPTKIQGLRRSSSWARDQWLYFAIEFSQPFDKHAIFDSAFNDESFSNAIVSGKQLNSFFEFHTNGKDPLIIKCALSPVSCAGAWKNMQAEIPGWNFDEVKNHAKEIWNKELSKIDVTSYEDEKKDLRDPTNKIVIFYTALYHCMLAPNIYEDVDGKYRGRDNKIHTADNFDYYTVFSLWDTYRALHPLLTIIDQKRTSDFINTFLMEYQQGGRLPVWELSSNETNCMIGYHSVSVIADAAIKGIKGFDYELAYEAMQHSANLDIYGLKYYKEKGYIESNEEPESVSKTLEYSYDDWCIFSMATLLSKKPEEFLPLADRALNCMNLMDGSMPRPRFNGGWYSPFNPAEVNFNFTEANAWQYAGSHPQNIQLIRESFLDSLFTSTSGLQGREQSDITGMIGQYAHGNEPSHNLAYLYNYTYTAPWKTQFYLNKIMTEFYTNAPDGLIGNEDCGQMSAWYVLSSIGFYPVCPGSPVYNFGLPLFDKVDIHLENSNTFKLKTKNNAPNSIYLDSMTVNNYGVNAITINHDQIMDGATVIIYKTSDHRNCINPALTDSKISTPVTAPIISAASNSFADSLLIKVTASSNFLFISTNGEDPRSTDIRPVKKDTSFYIRESTTVKAFSCEHSSGTGDALEYSGISTGHFNKLPFNYTIKYLTQYSSQYPASGKLSLIDGLRGSDDFRTGMWQGWEGGNMEVVLDMGEKIEIDSAGADFLQDIRSWIWMPQRLEIYTSDDGKHYKLISTMQNMVADTTDGRQIQKLESHFTPVRSRYIKFVAVYPGPIPEWHWGRGDKRWIFCDEIWVK